MNLSFYIAKRYLFSKKKTNIINIISLISVFGVAIGTIALLVTLSVLNGFDVLIQNLFSTFDPDLKILPKQGKVIYHTDDFNKKMDSVKGIISWEEVVEDKALVRYGKRQAIVVVKGIDTTFAESSSIKSMMVDGRFMLEKNYRNYAILGNGVAMNLALAINYISPLQFYYPKKGKHLNYSLSGNFNREIAYASGIFQIQQDLDDNYIILPIDMVRKLMDMENQSTAIGVSVSKAEKIDHIKDKLESILGEKYLIQDKYQQHASLFKIMKSEKIATYFILAFILMIASFNIVGSVTMLILDKQEDIATLKAMGAKAKTIKDIFLFEGLLIALIGALIGATLGAAICWIQQTFGILKLQGNGSFIIDAYPVDLQFWDIIIVFITVFIIGLIAAWIPVKFFNIREIDRLS